MSNLIKTLIVAGCVFVLVGCSSLDTSARNQFANNGCSLEQAEMEPQRLRFEILRTDSREVPADALLQGVTTMQPGQDAIVFNGQTTPVAQEYSDQSKVWLMASLGQDSTGNVCLKTRTAVRPVSSDGFAVGARTTLNEQFHRVENVGVCGESFLEMQLPGVYDTKLRVSAAPKSTAEYLSNPESSNQSSCSQMVETLSKEQGQELKNQLRTALGV